MANSNEIMDHILKTPPPSRQPITYQWLLPNMKGLDGFFSVLDSHTPSQEQQDGTSSLPTPPPSPTPPPALNTSSTDPNDPSLTSPHPSPPSHVPHSAVHEVSIFLAATDTFSLRNTNCTTAESLARFRPLIAAAHARGTAVRAYISVALGCPYEGAAVDPGRVADLAAQLLDMGAAQLSVADTTGMGTRPATRALLRALAAAGVPLAGAPATARTAFHFHDTYGQALVNTLEALEHGVSVFDSAVGGLGGCPYSPGATGNVATEDLVHCLHSLGVRTGVDLQAVSEIGSWISGQLGKTNESRAGKATLARLANTPASAT